MNRVASKTLPIYETPGEIGPQEREVYYQLAKEHYTGRGAIVEIGALFGASSVCFAQGLADNEMVQNKAGRIHVYDKFEVYPHLIEVAFPFHGIAPRKVGESFLDLYKANTRPYASMLKINQGDAYSAKWTGGPIEILFIDCAASAALYQHFLDEFYPHLIEGALIIDQDFFYEFAPWLPVKAELMRDQIKSVMSVDCALVARTLKAGPHTPISLAHVPLMESLRLMESQAIRWPGEIAALVHIQAAVAMWNTGLRAKAKARLEEISDWALSPIARSRLESAMKRVSK